MRQIMIVNLDNRTFHLDEEAFTALRRYLDRARAGLHNDPDLNEVLGDFERSIADKCSGIVQSGKNVIGREDMSRILEEMGPVADGPEASAEESASSGSGVWSAAPRKLYKQPQGAKLSGVCTGLGEFFGIDPVFIRIAFILLSLFAGLGVLAYIILEVLMPWPDNYHPRRHKVLWITVLVLALAILYEVANNWGDPRRMFGPRGIFGLFWEEIVIFPIFLGMSLIPVATLILVASLLGIASVKYLRSNPKGKE